jgi:hypothetical protein
MIDWLLRRFLDPPRPADEPPPLQAVEFRLPATPGTPHFEVHLHVPAELCLTPADLRRVRQRGARSRSLREAVRGFTGVTLPAGDRPVNVRLLLPPGSYTLQAGRWPASRRYWFTLASDGSLASTTLPGATDGRPRPQTQAQTA